MAVIFCVTRSEPYFRCFKPNQYKFTPGIKNALNAVTDDIIKSYIQKNKKSTANSGGYPPYIFFLRLFYLYFNLLFGYLVMVLKRIINNRIRYSIIKKVILKN